MSDKKVVKLTTEIGEYKGSPTLTVWEVLSDGSRPQYPVISFGKKKAKAIISVIEQVKEFATDMEDSL